jgi:hypothetical protein
VGAGLVLVDGLGSGLVLVDGVASGLLVDGVGSGLVLVDGVASGWVVHAAGFVPSIVMCANTLYSKPRLCWLPLIETHRLSASGAEIICVPATFLTLTW